MEVEGLNLDTITVGQCIDLYEYRHGYVVINDGKIVAVMRGDESC